MSKQPVTPAAEIATVNVILMDAGQVKALKSWPETPEGNLAAETAFRADAIRLGCSPEDLDAAVEDGFLDAAPQDLMLVHSC